MTHVLRFSESTAEHDGDTRGNVRQLGAESANSALGDLFGVQHVFEESAASALPSADVDEPESDDDLPAWMRSGPTEQMPANDKEQIVNFGTMRLPAAGDSDNVDDDDDTSALSNLER
jgi:hypothetical protein